MGGEQSSIQSIQSNRSNKFTKNNGKLLPSVMTAKQILNRAMVNFDDDVLKKHILSLSSSHATSSKNKAAPLLKLAVYFDYRIDSTIEAKIVAIVNRHSCQLIVDYPDNVILGRKTCLRTLGHLLYKVNMLKTLQNNNQDSSDSSGSPCAAPCQHWFLLCLSSSAPLASRARPPQRARPPGPD